MSDFKIIATAVFSTVTEVRLYDETIEHIKEGHPEVPIELPSISAAVENTIVNPTHIEESHTNSYVFVDSLSTNSSGDPLRVPVKLVDGSSGVVKSAYFASTGVKKIVWSKGTDDE